MYEMQKETLLVLFTSFLCFPWKAALRMWRTFLLPLLPVISKITSFWITKKKTTQLNNNTATQWSASRQKRRGSLVMKSMTMFGLFLHLFHASFAQSTVSSSSCEWVIFNTIHFSPLNLLLQEKVMQVAWVFYFPHSHLSVSLGRSNWTC